MSALETITKQEAETTVKVLRAFVADLTEREAGRPWWRRLWTYREAIYYASRFATMFSEFPEDE